MKLKEMSNEELFSLISKCNTQIKRNIKKQQKSILKYDRYLTDTLDGIEPEESYRNNF